MIFLGGFAICGVGFFFCVEKTKIVSFPIGNYSRIPLLAGLIPKRTLQTASIIERLRRVFSILQPRGGSDIFPRIVGWVSVSMVNLWGFFVGHQFPYDSGSLIMFVAQSQAPSISVNTSNHFTGKSPVPPVTVGLRFEVFNWTLIPQKQPSNGVVGKSRDKVRLRW
jgi:hypothetical protein